MLIYIQTIRKGDDELKNARFKDVLLDFRANNNLTQSEAAEVLGVSPHMIWLYENTAAQPSKRNMRKFNNIIDSMGVKTDDE